MILEDQRAVIVEVVGYHRSRGSDKVFGPFIKNRQYVHQILRVSRSDQRA